MPLPSLFVISLPRSLSSIVYESARQVLRLEAPSWTSAGEILNVDRYALLPRPAEDMGVKFTLKERNPQTFRSLLDFLDQAARPVGFAYKDVVHPFVVAEWLQSQNQFQVLRIKRCIPDVAFSMLARRWLYPTRAARDGQELDDSMIEGLIRADRALDAVRGYHVNFDDLVTDEKVLRDALAKLYPDVAFPPLRFSDEFRATRDHILARRKLDRYKELEHKFAASMASERRG